MLKTSCTGLKPGRYSEISQQTAERLLDFPVFHNCIKLEKITTVTHNYLSSKVEELQNSVKAVCSMLSESIAACSPVGHKYPPADTDQSRQVHTMSSRSKYMPAHIRGHNHFSYGGAVIPENVSITEYYDLTSLKKSNLRRNDELVPKPSEIDVTEKVIKVPVQREHPYASHIPRSALFPYSRSSDYASTNAVTLLNKTIGSSCRQEVLLKHTEPRVWPGQQGFYDIPKQMAGVRQVFYPAPPKITCPNPSLSARETALSAQNFHMFQNWERSRCHTAYQREYSGSQSLTRFDEKTTDITTEDGTPSTEEKRPLVASRCVAEMAPRPSVLELQDSYSKSDMRRDFYKSTNEAMVDLRDHMRTGKRFLFQGPRSHYYCNRTAVPLPVA